MILHVKPELILYQFRKEVCRRRLIQSREKQLLSFPLQAQWYAMQQKETEKFQGVEGCCRPYICGILWWQESVAGMHPRRKKLQSWDWAVSQYVHYSLESVGLISNCVPLLS